MAESDASRKAGLLRTIFRESEGKILIAGIAASLLYLGGVLLTRFWSADLPRGLLTMTSAHVIGGRAAGLSSGYLHGLPATVVIAVDMVIETLMVLIGYPLFVLSYRHLIVIEPLQGAIERAQRAAKLHEKRIMRYGIPGLLLFVWFPFWMTGPLMGSIIGFLIGLRARVNLSVVLAGTYLAILCWGLVLRRVHDALQGLGFYVPIVLVSVILILAISLHIRHAFAQRARALDIKDDREGRGES